MLATLFDFPFEDRYKLTRWSDVATGSPETGVVETEEQRRVELMECLEYFTRLWKEREGRTGGIDLVSMLAQGESTRNSISGGVWAMHRFPDEARKLWADPGLIPNAVSEIIRWQTPLAYMRRTAVEDLVFGGQRIRAGDKVAMWYVSGNRDESVFESGDALCIDRPNARQHLSFGFGIHRCMGNRVGEMQLRILWEELIARFRQLVGVGQPVRVPSSFVKGYRELPVVAHPH